MAGVSVRRPLVRIGGDDERSGFDQVATEEPLEIRIGDRPLAVTMRSPGHDFDLVTGFLVTEGIIGGARQVRAMRYCVDGQQAYNVVTVDLHDPVSAAAAVGTRSFFISSSCGLCGKASIDTVRARSPHDVAADRFTITPSLLSSLPARMRDRQRAFDLTGGLHAAGLFDADGELLCLREDVGRHNAFDKVIGWATREGRLPLRSHVILASGRASFELTQKALMAGIPVLAAVSAASSLAVDLAEESGMTLVGFLRADTMNVYAGRDRVVAGRTSAG